jgi:predicted DNA-binding transcriptional regulator YafY
LHYGSGSILIEHLIDRFMLPKLEKLVMLDRLLRSGRRYTAEELAIKLGVKKRSVHNYLDDLRDKQAPIENNREQGYFYSDSSWRLKLPLTDGELFVLALGTQMLQSYAGSAYEEDLKRAISRLADRLPEVAWVDLQQLAEQNVVLRASATLDLNPTIWRDLERACQQRRRVSMVYYHPQRREEGAREFEPYILHFNRNNPYVTGFCCLRQAVRDFRVDRVRSVVVLADKFEVRADFDRREHFGRAFQYQTGQEVRSIAIWFDVRTAPYIRERCWHPTQVIEELAKDADGDLVLRFEAPGLEEVKRWVMFYGKGAVVREPPELVAMVKQEIAEMTAGYEDFNQ